MKSYNVSNQIKAMEQYFPVVMFVQFEFGHKGQRVSFLYRQFY